MNGAQINCDAKFHSPQVSFAGLSFHPIDKALSIRITSLWDRSVRRRGYPSAKRLHRKMEELARSGSRLI